MNKFVIIIALTILFKPVLPVVGYIINYDYIIRELCENRNNAALNCNGKCQLKKELASATDYAEGNTTERKIKINDYEVLFINTNAVFLFSKVIDNINKTIDAYYNFYNYNKSSSIFHPPLLH